MKKFKLQSSFKPAGDQTKAIQILTDGLRKGARHQTLLGVTGSGKTFTAANVIAFWQKPTLVIAHNKTLAAQLAQEYRDFFPDNAVHYFVSYYDYYQPEAYLPASDTYIEKEAQINAEIERLRHASTQALLTRRDVIIVASVSCIYGLGSPAEYERVNVKMRRGIKTTREEVIRKLVDVHFSRTNTDLTPGVFRAVGNMVEIMPMNERIIYRLSFAAGAIAEIEQIDYITRHIIGKPEVFFLFPAKHFITDPSDTARAITAIEDELAERLKELDSQGKILEVERLKRRTKYDLALIREIGYCNGIENYSRHFSGKLPGEPPDTLLSYFTTSRSDPTLSLESGGSDLSKKPDFLTIIDESHVTIPQLRGMQAGDASRKTVLVEHGFRLPSAKDNRPLTFTEFESRVGQVIYTSATPGPYELEHSTVIAEQIIRPTGLVDPELVVRPITGQSPTRSDPPLSRESGGSDLYQGQIKDFLKEAGDVISRGGRVIATTLTKKMAEDLAEYLSAKGGSASGGEEKNIKAEYLHSDIKTIERIEILTSFRKGEFDCIVGVNLLREGLDLPEVELIGILDADKEGFLRSETSLIQIIGRAARNVLGRVIIYADHSTGSIERAVKETNRRRARQLAYNKTHGITPQTIHKQIKDITEQLKTKHHRAVETLLSVDQALFQKNPAKLIKQKEAQMNAAVKILDFETAAILRDELKVLQAVTGKQVTFGI